MALPGWVVTDGLLECRADGGLLRVQGKIGCDTISLHCARCRTVYKLDTWEVERLTEFIELTRRAYGTWPDEVVH